MRWFCAVYYCLGLEMGLLVMRAEERPRAASWGFGHPTDSFESYISPVIWIIEKIRGSPYGFGLIHWATCTDLVGPKCTKFQKQIIRVFDTFDLWCLKWVRCVLIRCLPKQFSCDQHQPWHSKKLEIWRNWWLELFGNDRVLKSLNFFMSTTQSFFQCRREVSLKNFTTDSCLLDLVPSPPVQPLLSLHLVNINWKFNFLGSSSKTITAAMPGSQECCP